jgi:precorrin-2 dehydrogenase/sirohydrochlorin ferrochelatase
VTERPAFVVALTVTDRAALVIGGDGEAYAKAQRLHRCGARVTVVWPALDADFESWARAEGLVWHPRDPVEADLAARPFVVVSSPRDEALSAWVAERAAAHHLVVCCIDQPDRSNYAHVAVADAGTVTAAFSSGGTAPSLLKRLRDAVSAGMGDDFADFTRYLAALRVATPRSERRAVLGEAVADVRAEFVVRLPEGWRARWEALRSRGLP